MAIQITLVLDDAGNLNVQAPLTDRVRTVGMLTMAAIMIATAKAQDATPTLPLATPEDLAALTRAIEANRG